MKHRTLHPTVILFMRESCSYILWLRITFTFFPKILIKSDLCKQSQRILHIFHINFKKNSLTYLKVISIVIIFKEDDKTNLIKDLFFKYSMLTVYSGNVLFRKKISSLGENMDFENKSTQRKNKIQKKYYKSAT